MESKVEKTYVFLTQHTVANISTVSKEGEPWGAAVYYAVNEELAFYFLTHSQSQKYINLKNQPKVALTVVDNNEQVTVQVRGKAYDIEQDTYELSEAFRKLAHIRPPGELKWIPPVITMGNKEIAVVKVIPDFLRVSKFDTKLSRASIEQII